MNVATAHLPPLPALVDGWVTHDRRPGRAGVRHGFRHRLTLWLVDVDDLPRPGRLRGLLGRIDPRDHFAGDRPLRAAVEQVVAGHGVDLSDARVVMLSGARVLGYVFDPISVFWCLGPGGEVRAVVAEVHNTYGGRHPYVLLPDAAGDATCPKEFYVSPFYEVAGRYRIRARCSAERVQVGVRLHQDGRVEDPADFVAGFAGVPHPATDTAVLRWAIRRPLMPQRVSALIRAHGIYLWARRLPVVPRTEKSP